MVGKSEILLLLILQGIFWGCDPNSASETPGEYTKGKLWAFPVRSDSISSTSDSIAFLFAGPEIEKFRLWNGCFTFFGKDSIKDIFGSEVHFDSIASASTDTLLLTGPFMDAPVRYLALENRCLDKTLIADLKLEEGGFEDRSYTDSDSVRFRFTFSIRPDKQPHDFRLILYGQIDYSNGMSFLLSHPIPGMSGEFDTTLSIGDLTEQWKGVDARYIRYGIAYFRSDKESPWLNDSGKKRVASKFE